jgi:hypothetical protein
MQQLPEETTIMIMVRLPAKASNLARPRAEKLQLTELIKLGSTGTLFRAIVNTTEWKKNIIFKDGKIFLWNQNILKKYKFDFKKESNLKVNSDSLQESNHVLEIKKKRNMY